MAGFFAKCGTQLADNVGFCPNCGNAVQSVQNIQTQIFSVHYCVDLFCEDTGKPNFEIVAYLK